MTEDQIFEAKYGIMDFSEALKLLKAEMKMRRKDWVDIRWVVLMPELYLPPNISVLDGPKVNERTAKHLGKDVPLDSQPYFAAYTKAGKWQPGWMPSTADILANDWMIVDD